jgi:hypothetical protein
MVMDSNLIEIASPKPLVLHTNVMEVRGRQQDEHFRWSNAISRNELFGELAQLLNNAL